MSEKNTPFAIPDSVTDNDGGTRQLTIDDLGLTMTVGAEYDANPKSFLNSWFQLFKTAQYHAIDNRAIERPLKVFIGISNEILSREGAVSLQAKDGNIFFNSMKIKLSSEEYELTEMVFEFFEDREMGGFSVHAMLDEAAIRNLLEIIIYTPPNEHSFNIIKRRISDSGIPVHINKTLGLHRRVDEEVVLERRSYTFLTYSKLVVLYRTLLTTETKNIAKRNFIVRKTCRTIETMIDICLEDDHTFLGISSVKSGEAYAPHHAANVTVLSLSIGVKLGLSKVDLADLGVAAMFSNIGQDQNQDPLIAKEGVLSRDERRSLERHPLDGVDYLLGERFLSKSVLRRIVVAFGHHLNVDGSGYPRSSMKPDLFSRIVAIADTYDALTTDRPWRKANLPDEALAILLEEAGEHFDETLVKIFVNSLGLYPVGTLVRLDSGELAVVIYSGGEGERVKRPIAALITADGKTGVKVDLAQKGPDGSFLKNIVRTEDPGRFGLRPSALIASGPVA